MAVTANNVGGGGYKSWIETQFASGSSSTGLNYPSPFLKFEAIYIPQNLKEVFQLLAHAYLTDSNINPAIENLAAYPITRLELDIEDENRTEESKVAPKKYWDEVLNEKLDARGFNIQVGYDYCLYGNAFCSVYHPFERWLKCTSCGEDHNTAMPATKWRWKNMKFEIDCSICKVFTKAIFFDKVTENIEDINLIRWSPYHMEIDHNPISGKSDYYYTIPNDIRQRIMKGDPRHLLEDPPEFIQAVVNSVKGKVAPKIRFRKDQIFAMQRPSVSLPGSACIGWGMPGPISSLRDIFFKNVMRRAQAMVLHEHIIPFRVFSPAMVEQPSVMMNLSTWRRELEANYYKWRTNPLHIMTAPIPLNVQQVGAQGKALALFAEMQMADYSIIKGMGVPREFVEGGLTYSGSSVSLRMLENMLHDYVARSSRMINWIVKKVSGILGVEPVKVKYTPFKMADDIQLKSLLFSIWQQGGVSGEKLGEALEYDYRNEINKKAEEDIEKAIAQATAQGKAQNRMQNIAMEFQTQMPNVAATLQNPIDPNMSQDLTSQLQQMPPDQAQNTMNQVNQQNPVLAQNLSARYSFTPQAIQQDILQLQTMPPEYAEAAMKDLQTHNPMKYFLMKTYFNPQTPAPVSSTNGGARPNYGGVNMKPAPNVLPPRSAMGNRSI